MPRVTLYTAGHLHTAVPHCSHSRAPIVHTAVPRENNEHGCVYLRCRTVCKLPGCVEGHPWMLPWEMTSSRGNAFRIIDPLWRETIGHRLPHKGPTMRSFDVIFVVSLGKLLNNQSRCRWFETPRHHVEALWRYYNQTQASLVNHWWGMYPQETMSVQAWYTVIDFPS